MDLVYIWYGNRYWSQVFSTISSLDHNLGVKVTDFEFLCLVFVFNFLELITSLPLDGFSLYLVW